jgi:hypothetical protein
MIYGISFSTTLEYAVRKFFLGLGTHQPLVIADDVDLLGDNINTIKKNMDILTDNIK